MAAADRERIKLVAFWAVTIALLVVSLVCSAGYHYIERQRAAEARGVDHALDPELLVGGGYDRTSEEPAQQPSSRGARSAAGPSSGSGAAAAPPQGELPERAGASGSADPRYLMGGHPDDQPRTGSFSLRSDPIGAEVLVDGRSMGITPLSGHELPQGRHQLRLEHRGYHAVLRELDVVAEHDVDLGFIQLEAQARRVGSVEIWSADLQGAALYVDERHVGRLPVILDLAEGLHSFYVQPDQGNPVSEERDLQFEGAGPLVIQIGRQ